MIVRSRAPLRLGLAGGGTDVSPYSDTYGGCILNTTISLFARATIEPRLDGRISMQSIDRSESCEYSASEILELDGTLDLLKSVYNRVIRDFIKKPIGFHLTTHVDAPAGSGLGTSSTLAVAILNAFNEWQSLALGEYDLAHLAWEIERKDLGWAGGKQDQYAATFGGFNFMEFSANDKVIVNPLRVKTDIIRELESNIVLYYMGTSRLSAKIIQAQTKNVQDKRQESIDGMHKLKEQSVLMKEALLRGNLDEIGPLLDFGWRYKKQTSDAVSNPIIDEIYEQAMLAGATGGKVSGAGGGGFLFFYCPGNTRHAVFDRLQSMDGEVRRFQFEPEGAVSWTRP